jgi:hypothetical protein
MSNEDWATELTRCTVVTTDRQRKSLEDECLIDSWKAVSLDPITSANQTLGKYYTRILDEFNEHRHIQDYEMDDMNHNEGAISHRWGPIKTMCNKFHGNLETICNRKQIGAKQYGLCKYSLRSLLYKLRLLMCGFL